MDGPLADAADALRHDHGTMVEVEDRTIRLLEPVNGDPGFAVLRALGIAQAASPVGAAAHGPQGVAAGVLRSPELYVARWTRGKRWVVGYKLTGASRVNDYVRTEGRLPTRLETGNWYGDVPDEVSERFLEAGVLLDEPPFPVPPPPPAPSPVKRAGAAAPPRAPRAPRAASTGATSAAASGRAAAAPSTRLCPNCRMHKAPAQFVPGSDLCVDCR